MSIVGTNRLLAFFSSFSPLLSFSKDHSISKDSDSVLNKKPFFNVVFIIEIILFQELRICKDDKDSVKSIADKGSHVWIGIISDFSEVVLIAFFLERFFCKIKGTDQWDERKNVHIIEAFEGAHPHIGFVDVFDSQMQNIRA